MIDKEVIKDGIKKNTSYKEAVLNVIGCIAKNTHFLSSGIYKLSTDDFLERSQRIIYGAIAQLAQDKIGSLSAFDVDAFLSQYEIQHDVFTNEGGKEFLDKAIDVANERKFDYYFNVLKKYSLVNMCASRGFDTSEIYDPTLLDARQKSLLQDKFDKATVADIFNIYESQLAHMKEAYASNSDVIRNKAGDGIEELLQHLHDEPDRGPALISPYLTLAYRGLRKGCLYTESSAQGVGKSRRQASESAHMSAKEIYNIDKERWELNPNHNKVLYISTELTLEEQQTMWLAYISGVPEEHILDSQYMPGEEERVLHAAKVIEDSDMWFVSISNYDIDDIINLITEYCIDEKIDYVFYDYLSTTLKIMAEGSRKTKIAGLREDQILLMFCTRLKDLARAKNIGIWTSTQLSGDWKNAKEADQQLLRGARAISDKTDCSAILLPIREAEKELVKSWEENPTIASGFVAEPTHVVHIFKIRKSKCNNTKLFCHFDTDTCRLEDCFVVDRDNHLIPDYSNLSITTVDVDEKDEDIDISEPTGIDETDPEAPFSF